MEKKTTQLCTSLFCNKANWSYVVKQGVLPFVGLAANEGLIVNYYISISRNGGDNIHFALSSDRPINIIGERVDVYFKNFFQSVSHLNIQRRFPVEQLFMSFPENSIQYGLYPFPEQMYSPDFNSIRGHLSTALTQGLIDECIDDSSILTVAYYLHLGCLAAIENHFPLHRLEYNKLYDGIFLSDELTNEYYVEKFAENKDLLAEIYEEVNCPEAAGGQRAKWLDDWLMACENEILHSKKTGMSGVYELHSGITAVVNDVFDINAAVKSLLYYFLRNIIASAETPLVGNQVVRIGTGALANSSDK